MAAFRPAGDRARWATVYGLLQAAEVGATVTYADLAEALKLDPLKHRHAIQMAVRRAAREFEEVDKRALEAIPNRGYRVVEPPEHLRLARRHQKKAGRALVRAHSAAVNVDLSSVDAATRHAFEVVAQAFALQLDFNRRLTVRQDRLEAAVRHVTERSTRSDTEIAELRARLERLERSE